MRWSRLLSVLLRHYVSCQWARWQQQSSLKAVRNPREIVSLRNGRICLWKRAEAVSVDSGGGLSVWSLDVAHLSFLPPNKDKDLPTGLKM